METVSSKEMKNRTGEIVRRAAAGERIVVTNRGRPVAVVVPYADVRLLEGDPLRAAELATLRIEERLRDAMDLGTRGAASWTRDDLHGR